MTIKELLTTYWSQVTLLLLAIGYLLKRLLDLKSKKTEINHSLFQQNRLMAIKSYFSSYSKVELMWNQLAVFEIFDRKLTAKEIDAIIFPYLNTLQEVTLELKLYLEDDIHKYYERLTTGMISINTNLQKLWSFLNSEESTVVKVNNYTYYKDEVLRNNKTIMDELCMKVKDLYK
jgi:hypothetical protein